LSAVPPCPLPVAEPAHPHQPEVTHTMPAHDPCHDDPGTAESCPGCGATTSVPRTTGTPQTIHTWSCTSCGLNWVISGVNPHPRPTHHADPSAAA
ncbi:MAG: hypothetical protein ACRDQX_09435, partial [Pseudonocardiaceae bacterium]